VYYLNIPKKFVAGTVYDPIDKEVIIGATCTLTGPAAAGKTLTATTDAFGDFWFHGWQKTRARSPSRPRDSPPRHSVS